jgi:hypothetical protein
LKCEKFTDDGRQVMAIVHMDLVDEWMNDNMAPHIWVTLQIDNDCRQLMKI